MFILSAVVCFVPGAVIGLMVIVFSRGNVAAAAVIRGPSLLEIHVLKINAGNS